ncbi:thioredoxin-like protein [Trichodelitschia bisporula]|uniref:Thioredoxin-like protein n=1 Tax=Trichodelitschia bisporula TaxID=703511 RepID=A0A6G1I5L2_9PEZI|nr:thioredoxin-like protein [Trichodelitschia bisporula]
MKLLWLLGVLGLSQRALSAPQQAPAKSTVAAAKSTADPETTSTFFNGKEVPPLPQLSGTTLDQDIKKGYWLVEFYSPWCHHCQYFAPTWQTLYEFYYTLQPVQSTKDSTKDLNSFTRYYDFHFGKVDCVAFGSACTAKNAQSYPTIILFKDGKEVKKVTGTRELKEMSKWVEEVLESIRPGSRPKEGPKLPKVGAKSVDGGKPENPEAKDKDPAAGSAAASKHNAAVATAKASAKASTKAKASDVAAPKKSAAAMKPVLKGKDAPNPFGKSVPLTAESFQKAVTTTLDPWFVKFYAPWCTHCQAMYPNWAEMAREMKGVLNVGEVNCDVEKRLCKDAKIHGYPTTLFFRGGERVEYNGLRGVGDLITFAKKAVDVGSGVPDIDAPAFEELEKTEEVIFVYFYDHATTSEDFLALDRLTLSLIGHAKLVKTKDPQLAKRFKISTWPRLMVSRDGKPSYYTYLAPKDMRDYRKILGWMRTVWQPIVPELTASNAHEIMNGKIVVLGVLSRLRSDEFIIARREIKNAALEWIDKQAHAMQLERQELRDAKQLRIEEAEDRNDQRALRAAKAIRINMDDFQKKPVAFAWVDGVFWERWIRTTYGIDVKDGERVIINDDENHRYWDTTITGNPIVPSRTSILETLPKVIANPPKIAPKSTTSRIGHLFYSFRNMLSYHPLVSFLLLSAIVAGGVVFTRRRRRWSGGFIQLDGEKGIFGGPSVGGKTD